VKRRRAVFVGLPLLLTSLPVAPVSTVDAQSLRGQKCAKCGRAATHVLVEKKPSGEEIGRTYFCDLHANESQARYDRIKSGLIRLAVVGAIAYFGTKYVRDTEARKKDWYVWVLFVFLLVALPVLAYWIYLTYHWLSGTPSP